jgi:hypothetical protein
VWPISVQCSLLRISLAGYHEHFVRKASQSHRDGQRRHLSDDALLVHIKWCGRSTTDPDAESSLTHELVLEINAGTWVGRWRIGSA